MANIFNPISCLLVISVLLINGAIAKDTLFGGQSLNKNEFLENGPYRFILKDDCNLVLCVNQNRDLWNSQTNGRGSACRLILRTDGNLILVSGNRIMWRSNTGCGRGSYRLTVQTDGNVVIYGGARALWATNTIQGKVL